MKSADYYQLLGISRSASQEALRHAFRKLVADSHPDHNPDDAQAHERTRQLIEAYKILSDPDSKRKYDASLRNDTIFYESSPVVIQNRAYGSIYDAVTSFIALFLVVAITLIFVNAIASCGNCVNGVKNFGLYNYIQSNDMPKSENFCQSRLYTGKLLIVPQYSTKQQSIAEQKNTH